MNEFVNQPNRPTLTGSFGGFFTPKMGFLRFLHINYENFKILISPLESAIKTAQFSPLKFFSTPNGCWVIKKAKHRMLYFKAHNVNLMENNKMLISHLLTNIFGWIFIFSFIWFSKFWYLLLSWQQTCIILPMLILWRKWKNTYLLTYVGETLYTASLGQNMTIFAQNMSFQCFPRYWDYLFFPHVILMELKKNHMSLNEKIFTDRIE